VKWLFPLKDYFKNMAVLERFVEPFIEQALALSPEELERLSKADKDFTLLHNLAQVTRDRRMIRDQILAMLLAGRDSTAATLSWAMYELSNQPEIWRKLRKEVLLQIGATATPTYQNLKSLTYLRHTLNETLRLYPALPYNVRSCR
jgi:cytochrome P450